MLTIHSNGMRYVIHYLIGDKRIASRIGSGSFNNVYGQNGSFLNAGQQDYAERINQIETQKLVRYNKNRIINTTIIKNGKFPF
ncbi:MAG: hypothetical protein K6A78_01405 [Prevotella sp.]|nr:hypothetical protein [Prevotella sp.]